MFGPLFPWYFLDNTTNKTGSSKWYEIECPMHAHNLYLDGSVNNPGYQQILTQFRFDEATLLRMKANVTMPRRFEPRHTPYHVDRLAPHYTVVYYVNDTNGATILRSSAGLKRVQPRKGRIVLFEGSVLHAHYLPTRTPRCVINFNFRTCPIPGVVLRTPPAASH
jgi:hypothetical protein